MMQPRPNSTNSYGKIALFGLMALLIAGVIWKDESFLADPNDREWDHIAPFKWWLLPNGIGGAVALFLGPFQFSETLRRRNLALHRVLGRFYIGGIFISAPLSLYIGYRWDTGLSAIEDWAQGGGWLLCALLALIFAVKRNIPRHRQWVARSYAFTFVFILARAPDVINWNWPNDDIATTYRWFLVFGALIIPDLILQADELFRGKPARRPA